MTLPTTKRFSGTVEQKSSRSARFRRSLLPKFAVFCGTWRCESNAQSGIDYVGAWGGARRGEETTIIGVPKIMFSHIHSRSTSNELYASDTRAATLCAACGADGAVADGAHGARQGRGRGARGGGRREHQARTREGNYGTGEGEGQPEAQELLVLRGYAFVSCGRRADEAD